MNVLQQMPLLPRVGPVVEQRVTVRIQANLGDAETSLGFDRHPSRPRATEFSHSHNGLTDTGTHNTSCDRQNNTSHNQSLSPHFPSSCTAIFVFEKQKSTTIFTLDHWIFRFCLLLDFAPLREKTTDFGSSTRARKSVIVWVPVEITFQLP
jgi:hypothetical protein